jgi:hypothetical protein
MNDFWILTPTERLRKWQTFRNSLNSISLEDACQQTVNLWSYAPFVKHYLDSNKDASLVPWPDPWTLLYENYYCDIAKALGMLYTLYFTVHKPADIKLCIYKDKTNGEIYNLVELEDEKYILNMEFASVVNKERFDKNLIREYCYNAEDLKLDLY